MPPLIGRPGFGAVSSPVTPVIWDKLAQMRGFGAGGTTEGAVPDYIGGGSGRQDIGGGWNVYSRTGDYVRYQSPTGLNISVDKNAKGHADVIFYEADPRAQAGGGPWNPTEGQSTGRAISRLGDVYRALTDYVEKVKPNSLSFTAASDAHKKVYDKVAPMLAKELGGDLQVDYPGSYTIRFKY